MIGQRLGSYEITAKLGEGGMGLVFKAKDSRLGRDVALKVLPEGLTQDAERLARFEREAKLLAQLNHPNIAQIYGFEASGPTHALVMELVEGPTLAERLEQGPLPFHESLAISLQIAHALEEAHAKGIVHRDLKPQNVKAPVDGKVKVLDFGLAKALAPEAGSASAELPRSPTLLQSPTLTAAHGTQLGVILGTAAYMAPEQARGASIDKRADIWAFGVVLYEMLVGRSLFTADTVTDTLAGVLKTEIDFSRLPATTPAAIRQLLRRCLERNPKNRLHDIADARIVLEDVIAGRLEEPAPAGAGTPAPRARGRFGGIAAPAAGLAIGLVAGALWIGRESGGPRTPTLSRFEIRAPAKTALVPGIALSPDGRQIAFVARDEAGRAALWLRTLDALEARELPGTDGAQYPFWAPDSRRIGFFSQRSLKWIDSRGGTPLEIAGTSSIQDVRGGAWGADDVVLYTPTFSGPLLAIRVDGGQREPATSLPADGSLGTMRFPSFLSDGRRFVFYASVGSGTEPGSIHLGRLGSLETKRLGPATSTAVWATPGYLLYCRGDALVAHRFDDASETLVGEPQPIGITMGGSVSVSGHRSLAVASNGTLVYRADKRSASEIVWVDRRGELVESVTGASSIWHYAPRLSPDGGAMAVAQYGMQGKLGEIWVHDLARKVSSRASFDDGDSYLALWLRPAGREILYTCAKPGSTGTICRISVDRPGDAREWLRGESLQIPISSTPDGRRVVLERLAEEGRVTLWVRDLDGTGEPTRLSPVGVAELSADVAPDGRFIAFVSDASREWEVYVRRLDGSGGAIRVSPSGGAQPLWRRDGRELFYVDPNGRLVAVPFAEGDPLRPGAPVTLFNPRLEDASDRQYDATADGQRFLLNRRLTIDDAPLVAILEWSALLDGQR